MERPNARSNNIKSLIKKSQHTKSWPDNEQARTKITIIKQNRSKNQGHPSDPIPVGDELRTARLDFSQWAPSDDVSVK